MVLDDAWQGVTDIVRGADLLDSTPRQLYLQELLGLSQPRYLHVPDRSTGCTAVSWQNRTAAADTSIKLSPLLLRALRALGQAPDESLDGASPREISTGALRTGMPG